MKLNLQEGEEVLFEGRPEQKIFTMWFFTHVIPTTLGGSFFTPLESPAIYSGVKYKIPLVSKSKGVNPVVQGDKVTRGLKPRVTFLTEFTFLIFMFLWIFFVAIPSGKEDIPFPVYLFKYVIRLAPLWFIVFFFYYRKLKETFHYYITNQRCIFEGGIFVKRRRNVPYHKITDVEINQNIIERILSIYSLKVFTPGTGSVGVPGFEKAEITFYGLKDAETPANIIQNILRKYKATGE